MSSSGPPPPGWYEDPEDASRSRWWTGTEWGPRAVVEQSADAPKISGDLEEVETTAAESDSGTETSVPAQRALDESSNPVTDSRHETPAVSEQQSAGVGGEGEGLAKPSRVLIDKAGAAAGPTPTRSPGWYPDPRDRERLRYWDGADWNDDQPSASRISEGEQGLPIGPIRPSGDRRPFPAFALAAQGVVSGLLSGFRIWVALLFALLAWAGTTGNDTRIDKRKAALVLGSFAIATSILVAITFSGTEQVGDFAADEVQADEGTPPADPVPDSDSPREDTAPSSETVEEEGEVQDDAPSSLDDLLVEALGSPNRDVSFLTAEEGRRAVLVQDGNDLLVLVALNDNLSNRLIRSSAQRDTVRVAEVIQQQPDFGGTLTLSMYFPLVDPFGNTEEVVVVTVSYTSQTLERINFSNLVRSNIWDIADARQIHPTLQD